MKDFMDFNDQLEYVDTTFADFFAHHGFERTDVDNRTLVVTYRNSAGGELKFGFVKRGSHTGFEGVGYFYPDGKGHVDSFKSICEYLVAVHNVDLTTYELPADPYQMVSFTISSAHDLLADWYQPVISQPDFGEKLAKRIVQLEDRDQLETFFGSHVGYLHRRKRVAEGHHDLVATKLEAKQYGSELLNIADWDLYVDQYDEVSAFLVYNRAETQFVFISFDGTYLIRVEGIETIDFFNAHASGQRTGTLPSAPTQRMILTDAKAKAGELFNVPVSTFDQSVKHYPDLEAHYLWENFRGGRALVVGYDGSVLFANSGINPTDHRNAFANGDRTPPEAFNPKT